jgi:tape measure domain-containing protein
MADDVSIRVRLTDAARAEADAKRVAAGVKGIGSAAELAGRQATRGMGAYTRAVEGSARGIGGLVRQSRYGIAGLGALGLAGVKWGLSYNAQVESARQRFKLFTDDVDGLTKSLQGIDASSQFDFGNLSDAAAMLGNQGVKDIPNVLQGIANAAAASGGGTDALLSIARAMGQIQGKGKLSMEEVGQLNDALAPGVYDAINKRLGVTKDQLNNLGNEGIDAKDAIGALTDEWTSGKMAKAASDNLKTIGGQWQLLTGNLQKDAGALTSGLTKALERDVLPAANRAAQAINKIVNNNDLSDEEKWRQIRRTIVRELGPFADDIKDWIDRADIPEHLGEVIGSAGSAMAAGAAKAAPHAVKAFVDTWMASPMWVKLMSVLYVGAKVKAARGVGGGGGLAGSLLGKGSSPANPMWVAVVNGKVPGVPTVPGGPTKAEEQKAESLGSKVIKVGKTAAGAGGALAAPEVAAGAAGLAALGGLVAALVASRPGPHATPGWAHGFGTGNPGSTGARQPDLFATVITKLDGQVVDKNQTRIRAKNRAQRGRRP